MKTNEIMNTITRKFHRIGFQLKKHSPEILVVAGVIGGVTSAVMACKATTKAGDIIEDTKSQLDIIHKGMEDGNIRGVEYTKEDGTKDLAIVYTQTAVKFIKLYGPAVVLGTVSIVSILTGHNITRKRNLALTAAYATIDNSFKQYRNRVIERFGEELDRELKYDVKTKEVEETVVNEDGTESKVFGIGVGDKEIRGFLPSLKFAFTKLGSIVSTMLLIIINLFTGKLSLSALSGPIGMYTVVKSAGTFRQLLYLTSYLSINLAVINAIPFPAFDGGRVLFVIIEAIKGSKVKPEVENVFHSVGFILLMLLMVYITIQDIIRLT